MIPPFEMRGLLKTGIVNPSQDDYEGLCIEIEEILDKLKANNIEIINNRKVTFTGGIFRFVWNWNPLIPIDKGILKVGKKNDEALILYKISFVQMFLFCFLMVYGFMGWPMIIGGYKNFIESLPILSIGFLWLFGGNFLFGSIVFPSKIKKAINTYKKNKYLS